MGFWDFLCRKHIDDLDDCLEHVEELETLVESLDAEADALADAINVHVAEKQELHAEVADFQSQVSSLEADVAYYADRVASLAGALAESIQIPDVSAHVGSKNVVEPYQDPAFTGLNLLCADLEYYALPYVSWLALLEPVQAEVDKVLQYRRQVSDCDDWALVMSSFLALAFIDAGLDKQGAFMIQWSPTHAYNAFMTGEGDVWIYEPQSGQVVGKLGDAVEPYDSWMVWFPEAKA